MATASNQVPQCQHACMVTARGAAHEKVSDVIGTENYHFLPTPCFNVMALVYAWARSICIRNSDHGWWVWPRWPTNTICDDCRPCHSMLKTFFFSLNSTGSLCLQLAQVPKSPNLVIFVSTLMTEPIALPLDVLPCTHAQGIISSVIYRHHHGNWHLGIWAARKFSQYQLKTYFESFNTHHK